METSEVVLLIINLNWRHTAINFASVIKKGIALRNTSNESQKESIERCKRKQKKDSSRTGAKPKQRIKGMRLSLPNILNQASPDEEHHAEPPKLRLNEGLC